MREMAEKTVYLSLDRCGRTEENLRARLGGCEMQMCA